MLADVACACVFDLLVLSPTRRLTAAFRFFAGHQITMLRKIYATAKREWRLNKHPREVLLTLLIEHAPPEYLERIHAVYMQLEAWWNANVKLGDGRISM